MRTKFLTLLAAFLMLGAGSFAQNNALVPIYFHCSSTIPSSDLFQAVCDLNSNYYFQNSVPVSFYIAGIDRTNPTAPANKTVGLNVYLGQSGSGVPKYSTQYDVILLTSLSSAVLTHEVGHYFGLLHPDGNNSSVAAMCSGAPCPGATDCCSSTEPNNWMLQGFYGPGVFNACQKSRISYCCSTRYYYPYSGASQYSPSYFMPIETLTPGGQLTFESSTLCSSILPNYITCDIYTRCPSGSNEYHMSKTITNYSIPNTITTGFGILSIVYHYYYSNGYVNTKTVVYDGSSPFNPLISAAPNSYCSVGGGGTGRFANPDVIASGRNIYIHTDKNLVYSNNGFEKAEIYDLSGRILQKAQLQEGGGQIDISSLPTGMYIFKAFSDKEASSIIKFNKL